MENSKEILKQLVSINKWMKFFGYLTIICIVLLVVKTCVDYDKAETEKSYQKYLQRSK